MKELEFQYSMKLTFDTPIENHRFTLKCIPRSNKRQEITQFDIDVYPKEFLSMDDDSFGNSCIYGYSQKFHDHFSIQLSGHARTGLNNYEETDDLFKIGMYKYQTDYTAPGSCILAFSKSLPFSDSASNYDKALVIMTELYQHFRYVQGVTNISTTAEDAFALGQGVCQDYSHIMISLCRLNGIPARYVVGMLMGEGLSHAWVEIFHNNVWIAFDPTNNLIVSDDHIKISNGRDYRDCTINQGLFTGNTTQTQTVSVIVTET